jgi:hypothetical protein
MCQIELIDAELYSIVCEQKKPLSIHQYEVLISVFKDKNDEKNLIVLFLYQ